MNGPTNFRSTGRRPGDTKPQVCQSTTGSAPTSPTIIEILMGMVSPSVGLVKTAVEVMWLLVLPRTEVSGRSRKSTIAPWKTNAATVLAIQAMKR